MPTDDTEPRWTTETYDPADPDLYPDHPEADDEPPDDDQATGWEGDADRQIPDEDDGPDVTDTQTGQGVD
jgi:hypothetical protein